MPDTETRTSPPSVAETVLRPITSIGMEGREVRQTTTPFVLDGERWGALEQLAGEVTDEVTGALRTILREGRPMVDEYAATRRLLRASDVVERPTWLRLDLGFDREDGRPQVLEINSACPGSWILTAYAAAELAAGPDGRAVADLVSCSPRHDTLARHLHDRLGARIALVNLFGDYSYELAELTAELAAVGAEALVVDPAATGGLDRLRRFGPTGIYWKSDPLRLTEVPDLVSACLDLTPTALAEPTWMTVGEDKRLLCDVDSRHVAPTRPLDEAGRALALTERDEWVLKPANLTRGAGIVVGRTATDEGWAEALDHGVRAGDHLLQRSCAMRRVPTQEGDLHGDLSLFVIEGRLVGVLSRVSPDPIVNLGRGGFLQTVWRPAPTLTVSGPGHPPGPASDPNQEERR